MTGDIQAEKTVMFGHEGGGFESSRSPLLTVLSWKIMYDVILLKEEVKIKDKD